MQTVHQRLSKAFGDLPVRKAVSAIGDSARAARERGGVRVTPSGLLTVGAGMQVRDHNFYGASTSA